MWNCLSPRRLSLFMSCFLILPFNPTVSFVLLRGPEFDPADTRQPCPSQDRAATVRPAVPNRLGDGRRFPDQSDHMQLFPPPSPRPTDSTIYNTSKPLGQALDSNGNHLFSSTYTFDPDTFFPSIPDLPPPPTSAGWSGRNSVRSDKRTDVGRPPATPDFVIKLPHWMRIIAEKSHRFDFANKKTTLEEDVTDTKQDD